MHHLAGCAAYFSSGTGSAVQYPTNRTWPVMYAALGSLMSSGTTTVPEVLPMGWTYWHV
jgi:hypothetical protein